MQDQKKTYSNFIQSFYCNDCITCQLITPLPHQKQKAEKQDFEGKKINHRISFDTKRTDITLFRKKLIYDGYS